MSRILVIFTGGTIGSKVSEGWISPDSETKHMLISMYRDSTGDNETELIATTPYTCLSEYLSAAELNLLGKCIADNIDDGYDGIIITHGTDTLQYTAAAVSFMLQGTQIPVVMVSAAYPLEDERSNGLSNFTAAVEFIKAMAGKGVFVSYKNDNEEKVNIHTGTRLVAHQEASADVYSIDERPYAVYRDNKIIINDKYIPSKTGQGVGKVKFCDHPEVLMIECRPGNSYKYNLDEAKAVIIVPYHSATLNTKDENFIELCLKAREKGIPVFLVNKRSGVTYESAKLYDDLRIEVLPFCSKISIYVKCWIGLSINADLREFVKKPVAQEFCE